MIDRILDEAGEILRAYFRIELEGLHNVPRAGRALVISNHSGFAAVDALMITHLLHREIGRAPRILAHRAFFDWFDALRKVSSAFGLEKVSVERGIELLKADELVLLFPEGEAGNFKPSTNRYHLQPFHSGFIRMALQARAPLVPCVVIGAEESQLNLGSVDVSAFFKGLRLPVPLNLLPLPSKWKIRFLEPIDVSRYAAESASDRALTHELSTEVQIKVQRAINHELQHRTGIFL